MSNFNAELPRVKVDTKYVAPTGTTYRPESIQGLNVALSQAQAGDLIEIREGTLVGNITLPNKSLDGFITIKSSSIFENEGDIIDPLVNPRTTKIITNNPEPVLRAENKAHHFRFIGIEFGVDPAIKQVSTLVKIGGEERTIDELPRDIIFDRCFAHGNVDTNLRRGISLNGRRIAVISSYISDCHDSNADAQGLICWNGLELKVADTYVAGAGENMMVGGADPRILGFVPSDIEVVRSFFEKPLSWNPLDPSFGSRIWDVRNIFELKNAMRVFISGNIFKNCWRAVQIGIPILFTVRNQSGTAPQSTIEDVNFVDNIVENAPGGVNVLGNDNNNPSQTLKRLNIENNLFQVFGRLFTISRSPEQMAIRHNTALNMAGKKMSHLLIGVEGNRSTGFEMESNLFDLSEFGTHGDGVGEGIRCLSTYFPGALFGDNILTGRAARLYGEVQGTNKFPATMPELLDYRLVDGSLRGRDGKSIGVDILRLRDAMARTPIIVPPENGLKERIRAKIRELEGLVEEME